jgi:hypothetical protein
MDLERIVELEYDGRRFTFRTDYRPPLVFWRVECDGKSYPSPFRVLGGEAPDFFRSLAHLAIIEGPL